MNNLRKATASLLAVSDSDETTFGTPIVMDIVVSNEETENNNADDNTNTDNPDTTLDEEEKKEEKEELTYEEEIERVGQLLFEYAFRKGYKRSYDEFGEDLVEALHCEHLIFDKEIEEETEEDAEEEIMNFNGGDFYVTDII